MYSPKNIEALYQRIGELPGGTYTNLGLVECICTVDSAWPNQLFNFNPNREEVEKGLAELEQKALDNEVPGILMLNPDTSSTAMLDILKGMKYRNSVWSAMSLDLSSYSASDNHTGVLRVEAVTSQEEFIQWLHIVEAVLMGGSQLNRAVFWQLMETGCKLFIGRVNNEVIGTAMLFTQETHAGIYLVAVEEAHRKKGYGKQLTKDCIEEAIKRGCSQVHLQATKAGKGVYESLGFEDYGDIWVFNITSSK